MAARPGISYNVHFSTRSGDPDGRPKAVTWYYVAMGSLRNLTPHPIRVYQPGTPDRIEDETSGILFTVEPEEKPARIAMIDLSQARRIAAEDGGPSTYVEWMQFGQCNDLPAPVDGVTYIVAMVVARDQTHRTDLIFPLAEVRDQRGTVVGCRGFGQVC